LIRDLLDTMACSDPLQRISAATVCQRLYRLCVVSLLDIPLDAMILFCVSKLTWINKEILGIVAEYGGWQLPPSPLPPTKVQELLPSLHSLPSPQEKETLSQADQLKEQAILDPDFRQVAVPAVHQLALCYREGKGGVPCRPMRAQALFELNQRLYMCESSDCCS
jgi:hypothetical protein